MTLDEFSNLRRGDVVKWVDRQIGLVLKTYDKHIDVRWEDGSFDVYDRADAEFMKEFRP